MMNTKEDRYENEEILNRYIWLHYDSRMETFRELAAFPLHNYFQEVFKSVPTLTGSTIGIDLGCSVGRATFELSRRVGFAIGMDLSLAFIKKAMR